MAVRPGAVEDGARVAGLTGWPLEEIEGRLAIGHGWDHFVLVIENEESGALIGIAIAGGAEGQSRKGQAEIFGWAFANEADERTMGPILIGEVLAAFAEAKYAEARWLIDPRADATRAVATSSGFGRGAEEAGRPCYRRTIASRQ